MKRQYHTPDGVSYSMGTSADVEAVRRLLSANELPEEDIDRHIERFLLAWQEGALIAAAGLELCGDDGLLRSVCVDRRYQNRGIATAMCEQLGAFARNSALGQLYLLTTSAQSFFERRGFSTCARDSVPPEIAATLEFSALCPSTAVCMVQHPGRGALYLPGHLLPLRQDVPGARMWAVPLTKTMLTYFEVEPNTRFETHSHDGEQITTVIEGALFFELEGEVFRVSAGEVMAIPAQIPHAVYTDSMGAVAFDAWSAPHLSLRVN